MSYAKMKEMGCKIQNQPNPGGGCTAQAMSFASPKAPLNALLPRPAAPAGSGLGAPSERTTAFLRYLESVEQRGGGEEVPDFPAGAPWFNSPPLKLAR